MPGRDSTLEQYLEHLSSRGQSLDDLLVFDSGRVTLGPLRPDPLVGRLPHLSLDGEGESGAPAFTLGSLLGAGGRGVVHAAWQHPLDRQVAVKRPRVDQPDAVGELTREAWVTGQLEHPNIIPLHLAGEDAQGRPVLVMKRVEGTPWSEVIAHSEEHTELLSRAPEPLLFHLDVLEQVCTAVEFAHARGFLHRDIKPGNVLLGSFGEVYLTDWGLAASLEPLEGRVVPWVREERGVAGTPAYMAPELAAGDGEDQGPHTDVYLLGACLYEVLAGQAVHQAPTRRASMALAFVGDVPALPAAAPSDLVELCTRALARSRHERPATVAELRRGLRGSWDHRQAQRLVDEAAVRIQQLRPLLEQEAELTRAERRTLVYLATESRFALHQALALRPDAPGAAAMLEALLHDLVDYNLRAGSLGAAIEILEALPMASASLERRLSSLRAQLADRERKVAALDERVQNEDASVGAPLRIAVTAALGLVGVGVAFGLAGLRHLGGWEPSYPLPVSGALVYSSLVIVAAFLGLREPRNQVGIQQNEFTLLVALSLSTFILLAWWSGVDILLAYPGQAFLIAALVTTQAFTLDRSLVVLGAVMLATTVAMLLLPQYVFLAFGLGNLAFYPVLAAMHRLGLIGGVHPAPSRSD